jgi:DMSO/TMAO reductase YedYZ molybdopterin-dependent catalytic subunit
MTLTRRDLLQLAPLAATPLLTARLSGTSPRHTDTPFPGMIVRMEQPRNLETPLSALNDHLPNDHFFVRSHFAVPKLDAKNFKVVVEGHVANRLEFSIAELKKLPTLTKTITLECAGNGRVFLTPQARGLQWGHGAVGTARWTGVPLAAVLERARLRPGATDVVLVGADAGAITTDPSSPGAINFDRSIPLAKALREETLLVWEMNGEPLPDSHGAPLRAIVGGWYGMASVKWLTRIVVSDKAHAGFWQTMDYSVWERHDGSLPQLAPVAAMQPKAVIVSPTLDDVLKPASDCLIYGMAWAGERAVARVELSTDGGKSWNDAEVDAKAPLVWSAWRYKWQAPPQPGTVKLVARCTDTSGRTQPETRNSDLRSYLINHLIPLEVLIK